MSETDVKETNDRATETAEKQSKSRAKAAPVDDTGSESPGIHQDRPGYDGQLEQAKEMAGVLRHKRDCPEAGAMPGDGERRIEFYPSTRPADMGKQLPAQEILIVRCIACGEEEADPDRSKEK